MNTNIPYGMFKSNDEINYNGMSYSLIFCYLGTGNQTDLRQIIGEKEYRELIRRHLKELVDEFVNKGMPAASINELEKTRNAIRKHRDEKGHDRCWLDDQELYKILPETTEADFTLPCKTEFLTECEKYWNNRKETK